jgi:hypothetical protein
MGVGQADLQHAYNAAVAGNIEPLVTMLAPDLEWRGIERGRWLWRKAPS